MQKIKKEMPQERANLNNQLHINTCNRILSILLDNKRHTRFELKQRLVLSDRNIRQAIEDLQLQGYRIINMSDGKGYFLTKNINEYIVYRQGEVNRVNSIKRKLEAMDKGVKSNHSKDSKHEQLSMF